MKCSIRELKEGTTYYFLEANARKNPETDGEIKIYKAKLTELSESNAIMAMFDFEGLEKNEVFFYQPVVNRFCGDLSNEILDKPITLSCNNIDNKSNAIIGTFMMPKGFIISDSIENAINEYKEFLDWSVSEGKRKAQEKIDSGDVIDGKSNMFRIELLEENYQKQISWLIKTYL